MSDSIQHECGIALIRLKKPIQYYIDNYGSAFYGVNKLHLLMEKQHNRGQDGAGVANIKLGMKPGERYISRVRSVKKAPIQDIFDQINAKFKETIENLMKINEKYKCRKTIENLRKTYAFLSPIQKLHQNLRKT